MNEKNMESNDFKIYLKNTEKLENQGFSDIFNSGQYYIAIDVQEKIYLFRFDGQELEKVELAEDNIIKIDKDHYRIVWGQYEWDYTIIDRCFKLLT